MAITNTNPVVKVYEENNSWWRLGGHQDANTTSDLHEARALYRQRIRVLEAYVGELELALAYALKEGDR